MKVALELVVLAFSQRELKALKKVLIEISRQWLIEYFCIALLVCGPR